ncbi:MAG: bifunctional pyr operon transcriptional regulator/uracil phosphoribosyltransferase PyrR [Deltaproteobacteria bacterium]|nr:bifunctional pyr operon transcriptional regulator/uracil phosphoribosyltransferase PyrR [Deltaproteobacteria bacterium]
MPGDARVVLDSEAIARALRRIAGEITERHRGAADVALVGIRRGGVPIAGRLARLIGEVEGIEPPIGAVDITLYRDDAPYALAKPVIGPTELPFDVHRKVIVLVDDVLYTGRTIRCAVDAVLDYGRPRVIEVAVLLDRGGRELPIRADYVGKVVEARADEHIEVTLDETGGRAEIRRAAPG